MQQQFQAFFGLIMQQRLGEASANVPAQVQSCYPEIPWCLMSDMRNVMAHEYFQVNLRLTWGTIQNNLPRVVPQLQTLLDQQQA